LHNATANQTGAAWSTTKQNVAGGFVTEFSYDFSSPGGGGADGLGFSIHNRPEGSALNAFSSSGAEHGPANSNLTITLDSWNGASGNSRLEIWQNGVLTNNLLPGFDLSGTTRMVRVEYVPGLLTVYFDLNGNSTFDLPAERVFSVPVDLAGIDAMDSNGQAWVGFSGRSGGSFENRDIARWTLATGAASTPNVTMVTVAHTGQATTTLSGDNSYDGLTAVNSGTLVVASSTALGSTVGITTVRSVATLALDNTLVLSFP
jgi:autotransporter-associated beta strand protein